MVRGGRSVSKTPQQRDSSSTGRSRKKKSLKTAKDANAIRVHREKANFRERLRMKLQNIGFDILRGKLPHHHPKKLSKMKTLELAIKYIAHLRNILNGPRFPAVPGAWAPAPNYFSWIAQQATQSQQHQQVWPMNADAILPDEGFVGEWDSSFYIPSNAS